MHNEKNKKKVYQDFDPSSGYPAGNNLFYECLQCGNILHSLPKNSMECTCKNISIDVGYGRIIVKDHKLIRLFSECHAMNKEKQLKRLEENGIIAEWRWPQDQWDAIADFYATNSDFSLDVFFRKGFLPIITIAIASSLSFFFMHKTQNPVEQTSGNLTLMDKLAMFGIIVLLILIVIWLLRWLHDYFYLRSQKGEDPSIIIGKKGIKLGNRFFFFNPPMALTKVKLSEQKSDNHFYSLDIDISCGSMVGKIAIPVPQGKIVEAQKVITDLSVKIKKIK